MQVYTFWYRNMILPILLFSFFLFPFFFFLGGCGRSCDICALEPMHAHTRITFLLKARKISEGTCFACGLTHFNHWWYHVAPEHGHMALESLSHSQSRLSNRYSRSKQKGIQAFTVNFWPSGLRVARCYPRPPEHHWEICSLYTKYLYNKPLIQLCICFYEYFGPRYCQRKTGQINRWQILYSMGWCD